MRLLLVPLLADRLVGLLRGLVVSVLLGCRGATATLFEGTESSAQSRGRARTSAPAAAPRAWRTLLVRRGRTRTTTSCARDGRGGGGRTTAFSATTRELSEQCPPPGCSPSALMGRRTKSPVADSAWYSSFAVVLAPGLVAVVEAGTGTRRW
jgi:hypothetical protein